MTSQPTHKFTALDILNRACEYGMVIALDGDNLVIDVPPNLEQGTKDKALSVISANKLEIVEYLHSLESVPLCYECLNEEGGH